MAYQISSLLILFIASLLLVVSTTAGTTPVQFTYSGSNGPANWGSLSTDYSACSSEDKQSPVNIKKNETVFNKDLQSLTRIYNPANATLVNNGFNVGIRYESDCGALVLDGQNYTLMQMHWHSPSEHHINGIQYPLELHLLHKSDSGGLAVVAILYQYGAADPFVAKIHNSFNELAKDKCSDDKEAQIALGILDNKLLSKNSRKYYRYVGSLTTPPCTENVTWSILGKVRTISKEQVEAIQAPLGNDYKQNARPLQSLNGRQIEMFSELGV